MATGILHTPRFKLDLRASDEVLFKKFRRARYKAYNWGLAFIKETLNLHQRADHLSAVETAGIPSLPNLQSRNSTPQARPSIWIIIPTYNERENVGPITDAVLAAVPEAHVLIVDDGSPDGTGELADEMARTNPAIAVLHRAAKQGLGRAYVAAFKDLLARDADILIQMDADFSHPVRFLPSLIDPLRAGKADLVLGSRYVKGGHIPRWNIFRRVISRGGSVFAGLVLLMPYRDLTGGFKAWRAPALREIDFDRLHAGGYAFQIETTFQARLAGARIIEVPITFEERRLGQSKMSINIFMEAFFLVLRLRFATVGRRRRRPPIASG